MDNIVDLFERLVESSRPINITETNYEKYINLLSKYSIDIMKYTGTPLDTLQRIMRIIRQAEEIANEKGESTSQVNIEELKKMVNERSLDVAKEMSSRICIGDEQLKLLEMFIIELVKNEGCKVSDIEQSPSCCFFIC